MKIDPGMRISPRLCPSCGALLDAASRVYGEKGAPQAGDISVCLECARPLQFTEDLQLRIISRDELRRLRAKSPDQADTVATMIFAALVARLTSGKSPDKRGNA